MEDRIERRAYLVELFDIYGELLTDKQQQMFDLYYQDDFSLGEIAQTCAVSRQAVFDIIKRTEHTLTDYEQKLHLAEKSRRERKIFERLEELAAERAEEEPWLEVRWLISQLEQV